MSIHHIFYTSNKDITWSTITEPSAQIIQEQADAHGYSYVELDCPETPIGEKYYINEAEDGLLEFSAFAPTFSTITPAIDGVVTVTGVPSGTEVFVDGVSTGTMSDTTLTFTATEAGAFKISFTKNRYYRYDKYIIVKRYGE